MRATRVSERPSSNQSSPDSRLLASMPPGAVVYDWMQGQEGRGRVGRLPRTRTVRCRGVDNHKAVEPSIRLCLDLSECPRIASQNNVPNTRNMTARHSATGQQRIHGNSLSYRGDIRGMCARSIRQGICAEYIPFYTEPPLLQLNKAHNFSSLGLGLHSARPTFASILRPVVHLFRCVASLIRRPTPKHAYNEPWQTRSWRPGGLLPRPRRRAWARYARLLQKCDFIVRESLPRSSPRRAT